jgi:hypothetical protein
MALFDDLPVSQSEASNRCTINQIKLKVEQEDCNILDQALASGAAHSTLAKALRAKGFKTSESSVGRHRRGECSCPKKVAE